METGKRDKESGLIFEISPQTGKPTAVFIESNKIDKYIAYMKEHALEKVYINNYKSRHVEFLKENTFITSVEFETEIADCSALNFLHNLQSLSIHHSDKVVDFSNFPKLENLNLTWNKSFINIDKCSHLKELTLWKYADESLQLLESFPELEELSISDSKIRNLDGIEYCKTLKSITLRRNRNLESIKSLMTRQNTLTELVIDGSKKLTDYNPVGELSNLKYLYLLGCGAASNADFVEKLNILDCGSFDIDIVDGQVSVLLERPIIFKNYKHFTHKNTLRFKMNSEGKYVLTRNVKLLE